MIKKLLLLGLLSISTSAFSMTVASGDSKAAKESNGLDGSFTIKDGIMTVSKQLLISGGAATFPDDLAKGVKEIRFVLDGAFLVDEKSALDLHNVKVSGVNERTLQFNRNSALDLDNATLVFDADYDLSGITLGFNGDVVFEGASCCADGIRICYNDPQIVFGECGLKVGDNVSLSFICGKSNVIEEKESVVESTSVVDSNKKS